MPQHATRTSFKPGQIANPNGRNGGGGKPAVPAEVLVQSVAMMPFQDGRS